MNKKEFFAAVNLYKRQPEITQWKNDFLPKAIAASAKEILAHSTGHDDDALAFANELASYTKKLDWLPDLEFAKISSLIEHSAEEIAEKYGATFDDEVLEHGEWKKHKYIRIENGRYIYPEDLKKQNSSSKSAPKSSSAAASGSDKKTVRIENGKYVVETEADRNNRAEQIKKEEFEAKKSSDFAQEKRDSANRVDQWLDRYGENPVNLSNPIYQQQQAKKDKYEQQANKLDINAKGHQQTADELKKKQNSSYMTEDDVKDARRQSNESAAKAQKEGEAMASWKKAQAEKETLANINGSHNAQHQAEAEGAAQQAWHDQQNKPKEEKKPQGPGKEKGDLKIDNDTKQKEYETAKENTLNKFVDETINMLIDEAYGKRGGEHDHNQHNLRINLIDNYHWDENEDSKDMADYVNRVAEKWKKKRESVPTEIREHVESLIMGVAKEWNKSAKHSIEPLSKDEYYAAIQQYHANVIEHRGFSKASSAETPQQRWERLYLQRAINDLKNNPHWRSSASKLKDDLDWWTDQPKYFDELDSLSSEEYRETMKKIIRGAGMFSGRGNEKLAHSFNSKEDFYAAIEEYKRNQERKKA